MSHFLVAIIGHESVEDALHPYWELDLDEAELKVDSRAVFDIEIKAGDEIKAFDKFIKKHSDEQVHAMSIKTDFGKFYKECLNIGDLNKRREHIASSALIIEMMEKWDYGKNWIEFKPEEEAKSNDSIFRLLGNFSDRIDEKISGEYIDKYKTVAEWLKEYYGYHKDHNGNYGWYGNPNAKWDWFQVGGRWIGGLKPKPGKSGMQGTKSLLDDREEPVIGNDIMYIKDIDWEGMYAEHYEKYSAHHIAVYNKAVLGIDLPKEIEDTGMMFWGINPDELKAHYKDAESYAKAQAQFTTWAVLTPDGKWHERGGMGWWGMGSNTTEGDKVWDRDYFDTFIKPYLEIKEDTPMIMVDCHI